MIHVTYNKYNEKLFHNEPFLDLEKSIHSDDRRETAMFPRIQTETDGRTTENLQTS